jgi:rubredoxin
MDLEDWAKRARDQLESAALTIEGEWGEGAASGEDALVAEYDEWATDKAPCALCGTQTPSEDLDRHRYCPSCSADMEAMRSAG